MEVRSGVMLSECSPGLADASRSTPIVEPSFMITIGVLRLRTSPPRRTHAALRMTAVDRCSRLSEKSRLSEFRCGGYCCQIFTIQSVLARRRTEFLMSRRPRIFRFETLPLNFGCQGCTKIRHASVDELHSIENRQDKVAKIFLTSAVAGVKTHSFFDSFVGVSKSAETTG